MSDQLAPAQLSPDQPAPASPPAVAGAPMRLTAWSTAWAFTLRQEGTAHSLDPYDAGNWSGGRCGAGDLRGSRYGLSAAQFPALAFDTLTPDQARDIAAAHYWDGLGIGRLPDQLAMIAFDGTYNSGFKGIEWVQAAIGVRPDGAIGPVTIAAAARLSPAMAHEAAIEAMTHRALFLTGLDTFTRYGLDWIGRVIDLAAASAPLSPR